MTNVKLDRKNRLLVVGNGFDLTAQAKTSYRDFFDSDYYRDNRELIFSWLESIEKSVRWQHTILPECPDVSCWDLIFCMESKYNTKFQGEISWCDIEQVIHDTLTLDYPSAFTWHGVFKAIYNYYISSDTEMDLSDFFSKYPKETAIMCTMLIQQETEWPEVLFQNIDDIDAFYNKLLEQLQDFEKAFGLYIHLQTNTDSFAERAMDLVNRLLYDGYPPKEKDECILHIDSFNYSGDSYFGTNIRHLNGDYLHPIFGIELTAEEREKHPEIQPFTKTSRRLYQDVFAENQNDKIAPYNVDQAIIYGHSLNKMDYDYFVYLFSLLRFNSFDPEQMGNVQFVYNVYNTNYEKEIKNKVAQSVYSLLNYFEEICHGKN